MEAEASYWCCRLVWRFSKAPGWRPFLDNATSRKFKKLFFRQTDVSFQLLTLSTVIWRTIKLKPQFQLQAHNFQFNWGIFTYQFHSCVAYIFPFVAKQSFLISITKNCILSCLIQNAWTSMSGFKNNQLVHNVPQSILSRHYVKTTSLQSVTWTCWRLNCYFYKITGTTAKGWYFIILLCGYVHRKYFEQKLIK